MEYYCTEQLAEVAVDAFSIKPKAYIREDVREFCQVQRSKALYILLLI